MKRNSNLPVHPYIRPFQDSKINLIHFFCKRILEGEELPRHDFGIYNRRTVEINRSILKNLRETVTDVDVVIINQKVQGSITNAFFIEGINELIADFPDKLFLVDSRHDSHLFKNAILRTNEFPISLEKYKIVTIVKVTIAIDAIIFTRNICVNLIFLKMKKIKKG